ncbi:S-adenosylmethionine-dependent tRNA (m5U54) methyltransferase [Aureococcus anophagefferens]|nr:S-adenosylmethionine-dependent tRNA (m5U54) methyltransferase [Aureococcus anophagefferens]
MGRFGGRFDERPGAEDTSAEAKRDRVLAHFPPAMVPRAMALITPAQPGRDRCRFSFLADAATGRVALSFAERGAGAAPVDGHALASRASTTSCR